MGKGPGTIYKDCIAKASQLDKILAKSKDNLVERDINKKYGLISLLEQDIRMMFFEQNYSQRTTDKALRQWIDLDLASKVYYEGYWAFVFANYPTTIKGAE